MTPLFGGVKKSLKCEGQDMTEMPFAKVQQMTEGALLRLQSQHDQMNIFYYSAGISTCSPAFNLYQVCKLYKVWPASFMQGAKMVAWLYPQQVMLRVSQVNMATVCKDHLDTWIGFAALGVLPRWRLRSCNRRLCQDPWCRFRRTYGPAHDLPR